MNQIIEDEKLKNFWEALKVTEFRVDDVFLQLPGSAHLFGKNDEPSKLFIRKCYNDLINVVFKDNVRKLRISGNPGIGKTFFGYYILYHLAVLDKTVIYDIHTISESNRVILFNQKGAFILIGHFTLIQLVDTLTILKFGILWMVKNQI